MRSLLLLTLGVTLAACELQEVMLAPQDDVIVVEAYLRTDMLRQFAFVHRTIQGERPARVDGAQIVLTNEAGERSLLAAVANDVCIEGPNQAGSCYATGRGGGGFAIEPGARYTLDVRLPDGRHIFGGTTVPGRFRVTQPSISPCSMPEDGPLELAWTPSDGAWAYVVDAELYGLKAALAAQDIVIEEDPFTLSGVAVSREDTTLVFPNELGVFERFNLPRDLLLALQKGLPDRVQSRIYVSAVDRNYVNWARRANFNPSGLVRVSSLRGDGIGVFGSLSVREIFVGAISDPWSTCQ